MGLQGGGWTLIAKVVGGGSMSYWGYGSVVYRDRIPFGLCDDGHTKESCKSLAYLQVRPRDCFKPLLRRSTTGEFDSPPEHCMTFSQVRPRDCITPYLRSETPKFGH